MIEAVLTFGFIIAVGFIALFYAAPIWVRRLILAWPMFTVMSVSALVLWIHWGTMTGLMSATVAGLVVHFAIIIARNTLPRSMR